MNRLRDRRIPQVIFQDPQASAWRKLYEFGNSLAMITLTGLDVETFEWLRSKFEPLFSTLYPFVAEERLKFGLQPFKGFNIQSSQSYHSLTVSGFVQLSPCTRLWILEWNSWDPAVPQLFHCTRKCFVESLPISWMIESRNIFPLMPVEKKI